ncbi:MAG: PIN domain-containing protein [Streptosporangiaceae bacterium]|nr:PIN domain-containing protein [Streptosporangiaceae bacterium]MBV9856753.1 PIN domain-containing protein [Streptosporangiaceae bacterium]
MTAVKTFVDTNVLVYAHDKAAGQRHLTARSVLTELWDTRLGSLSTQVLQEFYAVATRKLNPPLPRAETRAIVAAYSEWCDVATEPQLIVAASRLEEEHTLAFWDALIVQAAIWAGAQRLLSEDLQAGRRFGTLMVENPFREATERAPGEG